MQPILGHVGDFSIPSVGSGHNPPNSHLPREKLPGAGAGGGHGAASIPVGADGEQGVGDVGADPVPAGLQSITNQRKGNCYGVAASWPAERRRRLGVHMLHRAMRIFLAEGERQLRPADIQGGR